MRFAVLGILVLVGVAAADGAAPYPAGDSDQLFDGLPFRLRMPADFDKDKAHGLVVVLPGALPDLDAIADKPYIVVNPYVPPGRSSRLWSAAEIKVIVRLVQHLVKVLPIDAANVHAVAVDRTSVHDIFEMLVFRKKTPFASAVYVRSSPNRASVPAEAKKKMGVLAYAWDPGPQDGAGVARIVDQLEGKVRVVELRHEADALAGPYFAYWLHVMGGGFEPGYDLSFSWDSEAKSMDDVKSGMAVRKAGALLYFFSKADASSKDARALQNAVFFDRDVRARGGVLAPFKFERASHEALFGSLGLKATPAVVVLGADGTVLGRFEGKVKARALAKLLKRGAPK